MIRRVNRIMTVIMGALTVAAVAQELRLPPERRTWHGTIVGIPYEFRPPTPERVLSALWNKENPSILSPTIFGVGWTINLYRLARSQRP